MLHWIFYLDDQVGPDTWLMVTLRDQRIHVEFIIYWSPKKLWHVLVLVDTGTKSILLDGNPDHFAGPTTHVERYGGHYITVQIAQVMLGIGPLAPCP